MSRAFTLPGLLEEQAARRPRGVAIRQKRLGIWREVTWEEYAAEVRALALALDELGVGTGERVALFADNEPRWLYVDLAIQAVGGMSAGIYPALEAGAAVDAIRRAGARIVVCGDQEQVDRLLEGAEDVSWVERIVVFDLTGLHTPEYVDLPIVHYDAVAERGRALLGERPGRYDDILAERRPEEAAVVAFTPGTTGAPEGVLLCHAGEVALARIAAASIGLTERDQAYSLLPLAHAAARLFDGYAPLLAGSAVAFAESLDTVPADIVEVSPTVLVATPRLLERVRGDVQLRIDRAGRLKRASYGWAMRRREAAVARGSLSTPASVLADLLVTRFIRRHAGLARVRFAGIGGSFVSPELLRWFWALGVPAREQYGQVETGGLVTTQRGQGDLGTAGPVVDPAIEIRLDGGELLVRSPGLAIGTLDGSLFTDGWYRTGDLARVDGEGRVIPIGRQAQVLVTSSGQEISPAEIESALKASPYVASAMVVADGRPYVSAVIELSQETVTDWARRAGIPVSTYAALAANEQVVKLIESEVRAASDRLPAEHHVLSFRVLPKPLGDELTPTGKIRRAVIEERFAPLIEEMYAEHALMGLAS